MQHIDTQPIAANPACQLMHFSPKHRLLLLKWRAASIFLSHIESYPIFNLCLHFVSPEYTTYHA